MRLMSSIKDFNLNDDENRADVMRRSSGMGGRTRASSAGSADGRSRTSSMDHDLNNTGYDADAADEKDRDSDSHMKNKKVFVLEVHALCQGENLVWQERRERKESNSNTQTLPAATPPPASQYMHNGLKKTDSDEAWEATWVPAVRGGSAGVGKTFDASANPDIDTDAAKKSTVEYDIFDFDLTKQGQDKLKLLVDLNVLLFGTFVIALPLIQLHLDVSTVQRAKDESSVTTFSEIVISLGSQIEVPGTTRFGLWMLGMSSLMEQLTDTLAFRIKMLTTRSLAAENKSTDADIGKNDDADAEADANLVDTLQADKRTTVAVDNAIVAFMKNEAKLRGMRLLPSLCCVLGNVHCTKGEVQLETLRQQSKSALKAELEEENADDLVELSSTFLNGRLKKGERREEREEGI